HKSQTPFLRPTRRQGLALAVGLLTLLGLAAGWGGRATFSSRAADWSAHDYAYQLATVDFPAQSQVIGLEGEISALRYMQAANGLGLNARGVVANAAEARRTAIADAVAAGAPVFITREVEGIGDAEPRRYAFSGAGPLVRVWPAGRVELPPLAHPVAYALEGAPLVLHAAEWERNTLPGGPRLTLRLDWRATAPLAAVYKLSLRLIDGATGEVVQDRMGQPIVADVYPLRQAALTPQWPVDAIVRDVHDLPLPATLPPEARIQIVIYDATTVVEAGRWETPLGDFD
ncbi:MAG: hypothetical protein WDZ49_11130, partial [Litorilinea sp.]